MMILVVVVILVAVVVWFQLDKARCSSSFCGLSGSVITKGQEYDDGCRTRWVGGALTDGAGNNYSDIPMCGMWARFKTDEKSDMKFLAFLTRGWWQQ